MNFWFAMDMGNEKRNEQYRRFIYYQYRLSQGRVGRRVGVGTWDNLIYFNKYQKIEMTCPRVKRRRMGVCRRAVGLPTPNRTRHPARIRMRIEVQYNSIDWLIKLYIQMMMMIERGRSRGVCGMSGGSVSVAWGGFVCFPSVLFFFFFFERTTEPGVN